MKKKLLLTALFLNLSVVPSIISPYDAFTTKALASEIQSVQPYSNKIGYIYKHVNGKTYKRLWSYTYNKWLEPKWTPVE